MEPDEVLEEWSERAGIVEDGVSREQAERVAWERMAEKYGRHLVARALALHLRQRRAA